MHIAYDIIFDWFGIGFDRGYFSKRQINSRKVSIALYQKVHLLEDEIKQVIFFSFPPIYKPSPV